MKDRLDSCIERGEMVLLVLPSTLGAAPAHLGILRFAGQSARRAPTANETGLTLADERSHGQDAKLCNVDDSGELIERCRQGDTGAFRELFRRHREDVARLVYRLSGSRAEVEDLVQEVFLQVHRSLGDFRGDSRLTTWLYRVTVNVVLMHRRAARSRPILVDAGLAAPPVDLARAPDAETERRRRLAAFWRLLGRLSEKKRTVFILHELEGLSPSNISSIVDAPVLTVRTRLFYARRELMALMPDEPALAGLISELERENGATPFVAAPPKQALARGLGKETS